MCIRDRDMTTGEIRWSYQGYKDDAFNAACLFDGPNCPREDGPDFDFGASPILTQTKSGKDILLAGQKSGAVHALDPGTGELIWMNQVTPGSALGGVHWGMAISDDLVIVPMNDNIQGRERKPGVYGLDITTGDIRWIHKATPTCDQLFAGGAPWPDCPYTFSAAATTANDLAFAGSLAGTIYAFKAKTGEVVWRFETAREFASVNGVTARGGSIDNPGIQLVDDMLFTGSGYTLFGELPGNAILAFKLRKD